VTPRPRRSRAALEHLGILAAYFLLALVLTYPLVRRAARAVPIDPQIAGWYPGDGDPWHYLWGIWYVGRALSTFPPPLLGTDLVFFPLGWDIPFLPGVGLILGPGALLAPVVGLVLTYNILWWLSFALAGWAMSLLVRHLVADRIVAFVCGALFAFSTYRQIHSVEHLPIVMASFLLPLFALALLRAEQAPTVRRGVACALVLAASTGISWYCTVSLLVFLGLAVLVLWWERGLRAIARAPLAPWLAGLGALVAAASPFVLPLLLSPARDSIVDRPLTDASEFSADLLAFFVPSPRNPVFGSLTEPLYRRFTGNPYEQTVYLGAVLLALAALGALAVRGTARRLFGVTAVSAFVLALGPFLHVAGETLRVPLPYLLLRHVPLVRGARVPGRFVELVLLSLIVLAGYGLARSCRRLGPRGKLAVAAAVLVAALLETTLAPLPTGSARVPAVYAEIARSEEAGAVLELPLDTRVIKYHYYQTVHGRPMVNGNPVRPRQKYVDYPTAVPLTSPLRNPRLLAGEPDPEHAARDAARLTDFFGIRHVVIHGEYIDPDAFARLDRFVADHFPHAARRVDGPMVAYTLRVPDPARALWPERYVIDFGAPRREFALLTGWWGDERWSDGTTVQWMGDDAASMVVWLGAPADRVLELRLSPLVYTGAPPQSLRVDVNGARQGMLTLTSGWAIYRLSLPAAAFRRGLNTLTFQASHAASPARVVPGNEDARRLAVAFDSLTLGPAR
jgi:hypothetical protein